MEDGVFPHMRSLGDAKELEEERRLAYVGLTRAAQRLYLSRAVLRTAFGSPSYNPPSRFLDEIPAGLLSWQRGGPIGRPGTRVGGATPSVPSSEPAQAALARRPGVASPGTRAILALAAGDKVRHKTFGLGTVVATAGAAESSEATVDFPGHGVKRLLLRYAPLTKES
jgi:DNA helicase-2/ATP-dependent DNA helicase PcrA